MKPTLEQIVALAQEVEIEDPIDWGMLAIDETSAYRMIAASVLEMYEGMAESDKDVTLLSIIIKLTVENFVLNLKLLSNNR